MTAVPSLADVARVLGEHRILTFTGNDVGGTVCLCDHRWRLLDDHRAHLADVVAALYADVVEQADHYHSTACQHDLHQRCRQVCKFCEQTCRCRCHQDETRESK